eukprot:Stramenopile-MAST_4_protein_5492
MDLYDLHQPLAIVTHSTNSSAQTLGCRALSEKATEDDTVHQVLRRGGLGTILMAARNIGKDPACRAVLKRFADARALSSPSIQLVLEATGYTTEGDRQYFLARAVDTEDDEETWTDYDDDNILRRMLRSPASPTTQAHGCTALFEHTDESAFLGVMQRGGISVVFTAMATHLDSVEVQGNGCKVLARLIPEEDGDAKNAATAEEMARNDGVHTILSAMARHPENVNVQSDGCNVLYNMCRAYHPSCEKIQSYTDQRDCGPKATTGEADMVDNNGGMSIIHNAAATFEALESRAAQINDLVEDAHATHDKKLKFLCVAKLVLDEFPEMLRHLLRQKWNAMVERYPGVERVGWQRIEKSMSPGVVIGKILDQGVHGNTEDVVVSLGPGRFVLTRGGTLGNQPQLEFDREITSVMGKDQKVTITRGNRPGISGKLCWKKKKSKWILETDKNSQSEQVAKSIGSDELEFEEAFFSRKVTNTVFAKCNCSKCHDRHEPNYAKVPAATNKLDELDAPVLVHELTRANEG